MAWHEEIVEGLKANGIRLICHVPDLVLDDLIRDLERDGSFQIFPVTREEEGVGILSGAYPGGAKGALLLQSTGLGSLCIPQQIPFL